MTKRVDDHFQERVDELLVLEQRADRRAKKLIEITMETPKQKINKR